MDENPPTEAPAFVISDQSRLFTAIEYPGPISPSPASLSTALSHLGGLDSITQSLNESRPIELNLERKNSFCHPVLGRVNNTGNLLVKLVKRRRRGEEFGDVKMELVGVVDKTVRFRGMADFQMEVPKNDSIVQVAQAIREMDVEKITSFTFAPPVEDFSDILLIPPPVFSRITVPNPYNYTPSTSSKLDHNALDINKNPYTRSIHKSGAGSGQFKAISLKLADKVPSGPGKEIEEHRKDAAFVDKAVIKVEVRFKELFEIRPMWSRGALYNQLSEEDLRVANNNSGQVLAMSCYTWAEGPFNKLLCRFGWDPRVDRESRFLQHLVLRNLDNVRAQALPVPAPAVTPATNAEDKGKGKEVVAPSLINPKLSHTFDGVTVHREIGNFQLIDITDPILVNFIKNEKMYRPAGDFNASEGYWVSELFDIFRRMIKFKFTGIWKGNKVDDIYLQDLVEELEQKIAEIDLHGRTERNVMREEEEMDEDDDEEDEEEEMQGEVEGEDSSDGGSSQASAGTARSKTKSKSKEKKKEKEKEKEKVPKKVAKLKAPWVPTARAKNKAKPAALSGEVRAQALRDAIGLTGAQEERRASIGTQEEEEEEAQSTGEE